MARWLIDISKKERLYTPGKPGKPFLGPIYYFVNHGDLKELTEAQRLALVLNESCVQQGKGMFCWYPEYMHNVMILFYNIELLIKHRTNQ